MNKLPKLTIEDMATMMADGDFYTASELGRNKPWLDVAVEEQNLPKATINKIDFYHRPSLDKLVEKNAEQPGQVFSHSQVAAMIKEAVTAAVKEQLGYNPNTLKPVPAKVKAKSRAKKHEEFIDTSIYITSTQLAAKYGMKANTVSTWCRDGKIPSKFGRGKTPNVQYWVNPNDQKVLAYIGGFPGRKALADSIGQGRAS